jgi:amino acid permease
MKIINRLSSWYGLLLLTEAGVECNVLEYGGLAFSAFGRNGERICDIAIIILSFGAQLSYILIVGQTISNLLNSWGCHDWLCLESTDAIIAVTCFVTPICMFRHFGHLAWLSIFSIFTIVTIIFLTLIGGPLEYQPNKGNIKYFNINGFLSSFGSIIFALSCASANFQAYISTEKKSQNYNKWKYITGFATFGGALMCFIMGLSGYLSFRNCTGNNILDNFPQKKFDFFQVMICVHLILYIPVNFVIMRYSICKMALNKKSEILPFKLHTIITISLLAFTTFITVLIGSDGLSTVFNFTGGIGGSINCFVLPSLIYIKVMPKGSKLSNIAYIILFIGIFIMISVPVELIVSIVRKTNTSLPEYC